MKRLFVLFFIFTLLSSVAYSYTLEVTEWDPSENIALLNKLEKEYWKKHYVDEETINGGPEAYYREVLVPYDLNKKKMEDLPKRYYKIEDIK